MNNFSTSEQHSGKMLLNFQKNGSFFIESIYTKIIGFIFLIYFCCHQI
jgi:hypothetical protein